MNKEIKYIGTTDAEVIRIKSSRRDSSRNSKTIKYKSKKYNIKLSKFISSTKSKLLSKKVIMIIICIVLIYFLKPITFLRNELDEKREYYAQFGANPLSGIRIVESMNYMHGGEYYKYCKDAMVYPADGKITYPYDIAHKGIDIACDEYSGNVYAVANGIVVSVGYSQIYGNDVLIQHNINGMEIYTYYANLTSISVYEGQTVYQNEVIAVEGDNPDRIVQIMDSKGHHVHFEVRKGKEASSGLNPLLFLND